MLQCAGASAVLLPLVLPLWLLRRRRCCCSGCCRCRLHYTKQPSCTLLQHLPVLTMPPHRTARTHCVHVCQPPQVSGERDFFAKVVVDAVTKLDPETLDLRMLGIKKVQVRGNQASKVGAGNVCEVKVKCMLALCRRRSGERCICRASFG